MLVNLFSKVFTHEYEKKKIIFGGETKANLR